MWVYCILADTYTNNVLKVGGKEFESVGYGGSFPLNFLSKGLTTAQLYLGNNKQYWATLELLDHTKQ